MTNKKLLEKAIKERDEFLQQHPYLQKQQDKITETLDKTPEDKRMEVISVMMFSKLVELQNELTNLVINIGETVSLHKNKNKENE